MQKILDFFKEISEDEAAKQKLQSVSQKLGAVNSEEDAKKIITSELVPLAKSKGYNITAGEFIEFLKNANTELTDDALAMASGGRSTLGEKIGNALMFIGAGTSLFAGMTFGLGGSSGNTAKQNNRPAYVQTVDNNRDMLKSTMQSNSDAGTGKAATETQAQNKAQTKNNARTLQQRTSGNARSKSVSARNVPFSQKVGSNFGERVNAKALDEATKNKEAKKVETKKEQTKTENKEEVKKDNLTALQTISNESQNHLNNFNDSGTNEAVAKALSERKTEADETIEKITEGLAKRPSTEAQKMITITYKDEDIYKMDVTQLKDVSAKVGEQIKKEVNEDTKKLLVALKNKIEAEATAQTDATNAVETFASLNTSSGILSLWKDNVGNAKNTVKAIQRVHEAIEKVQNTVVKNKLVEKVQEKLETVLKSVEKECLEAKSKNEAQELKKNWGDMLELRNAEKLNEATFKDYISENAKASIQKCNDYLDIIVEEKEDVLKYVEVIKQTSGNLYNNLNNIIDTVTSNKTNSNYDDSVNKSNVENILAKEAEQAYSANEIKAILSVLKFTIKDKTTNKKYLEEINNIIEKINEIEKSFVSEGYVYNSTFDINESIVTSFLNIMKDNASAVVNSATQHYVSNKITQMYNNSSNGKFKGNFTTDKVANLIDQICTTEQFKKLETGNLLYDTVAKLTYDQNGIFSYLKIGEKIPNISVDELKKEKIGDVVSLINKINQAEAALKVDINKDNAQTLSELMGSITENGNTAIDNATKGYIANKLIAIYKNSSDSRWAPSTTYTTKNVLAIICNVVDTEHFKKLGEGDVLYDAVYDLLYATGKDTNSKLGSEKGIIEYYGSTEEVKKKAEEIEKSLLTNEIDNTDVFSIISSTVVKSE